MMDEKDAIALMAGTIEDMETAKNGYASVDQETFESMMNAIDSRITTLNRSVTNLNANLNEKLSDIEKRVYNLEYSEHCTKSRLILDLTEFRKKLESLMYKVDQMDAALRMSKKYRKRRAKVGAKD